MPHRSQPNPAAPSPEFTPVLSRAVHDLNHHHTEELVRQTLTEVARHTTGPVTTATVTADVALWVAVLAGEVSPATLDTAFAARATAHTRAGLSAEDSLVLHHACVEVLHRALTGRLPDTRFREALERVFLGTALRALRVANASVVRGRVEDAGRGAHGGPPSPEALDAPRAGDDHTPPHAPPRWCLVALRSSGHDGKDALRRFRAANPLAVIAVAETHVTAFTRHRPTAADVLAPYALVPVADGNTGGAARQATLAAVVARRYGRSLDTEQVSPLVAALDLTAKERSAFITARLGSLHTDPRHRYLQQTLAAYLAHNLCSASAARSLYIHRHTLTYRLRSIRVLTGLDLNHPFDRLQAELALILSDADALFTLPRRRTA
ncbi:PucR family transcriptional regulator [Streptomyces sp. NPDC016845]|uniref:PucR family transcriptional regulator n=1 Tax=Streptomyces sp. NPDC016845 TaxID=3364972 RepID=UPI0037AF0DA9